MMISCGHIDTLVVGGMFDEEFRADTGAFFGLKKENPTDQYIQEKVAGRTSRTDCRHIAMATISHADVLVSWNFKHIINLK